MRTARRRARPRRRRRDRARLVRAAPGSARRCASSSTAGGSAEWRGVPSSLCSATDGNEATRALLGEQMARLRRIAHRVVWVNPHRGKDGYEAVQQGVRRGAARICDDFVAGHSLATYAELVGGDRAMREVLPELLEWWRGRRDGRRRHRRRDLPLAPRVRRAPRCWSAPTRPPSARCPAAASRAPSTSSARRSSTSGDAGAPALRHLRRRRVRRRPDLRRHPRRLRREGLPRDVPRARGPRRRHRGRPAGRASPP